MRSLFVLADFASPWSIELVASRSAQGWVVTVFGFGPRRDEPLWPLGIAKLRQLNIDFVVVTRRPSLVGVLGLALAVRERSNTRPDSMVFCMYGGLFSLAAFL